MFLRFFLLLSNCRLPLDFGFYLQRIVRRSVHVWKANKQHSIFFFKFSMSLVWQKEKRIIETNRIKCKWMNNKQCGKVSFCVRWELKTKNPNNNKTKTERKKNTHSLKPIHHQIETFSVSLCVCGCKWTFCQHIVTTIFNDWLCV